MKNTRLAFMLMVAVAISSIAIAADSTYTLTSATSSTPPNGVSQAGALPITNGFRGVSVSIYDRRDGSVTDNDLIQTVPQGFAWISTPADSGVQPDGGGGWLRFPALDVNGIADAGGRAAIDVWGVQGQTMEAAPPVTNGLVGRNLYYTTGTSVVGADGGLPAHFVTITTLY